MLTPSAATSRATTVNASAVMGRPSTTMVWVDGSLLYDANDPKRRPVSDFELGQPGMGDVK